MSQDENHQLSSPSPPLNIRSSVQDEDFSNDSFEFPKPVDEDLFWEKQELVGLLAKDELNPMLEDLEKEPFLAASRRRELDWMRKVNAYYSFSASTAVLAVNYLDRFVSRFWARMSSPWMSHLAAVACLSLAAKMEETQVPLLLDLQIEENEYVFEAKTIQRMEVSVLSVLEWKMNPVTPISFIDHMARRVKLGDMSHVEFLSKCEAVLMSVLYDSRYALFLPSVMAGSVMLHVMSSVDPCNAVAYQNKLLGILHINKRRMDDCSSLIMEVAPKRFRKQSYQHRFGVVPCSPKGVMDISFSSDSSNESWAAVGLPSISPDPEPLQKKSKSGVD